VTSPPRHPALLPISNNSTSPRRNSRAAGLRFAMDWSGRPASGRASAPGKTLVFVETRRSPGSRTSGDSRKPGPEGSPLRRSSTIIARRHGDQRPRGRLTPAEADNTNSSRSIDQELYHNLVVVLWSVMHGSWVLSTDHIDRTSVTDTIPYRCFSDEFDYQLPRINRPAASGPP